MINTLHEDGGTEILDAVHYLVVEKLTSLSKWQEEALLLNSVAFKDTWSWLMVTPEKHLDVDAVAELRTTHSRNNKMPKFDR